MSKEEEIQNQVINKLERLELYPFSVIFTYSINTSGLLSITFFIKDQLDYLLELLNYKSECDKTGYIIIPENLTILLSGLALLKFYSKI